MTDRARIKFYFPEWNACCRANHWRTEHGRLVVPREPLNVMHRDLLAKVYACAEQLQLRSIAPVDALRHACHIVALGKNKSCKDLTNDELDRVVDLFRVLRNPESLAAVQSYEDPERHKKQSLIAAVKKKCVAEAYYMAIARDLAGHSPGVHEINSLEALSIAQLGQLCSLLNAQRKKRNRPVRDTVVAPRRQASVPSSHAFPKLQYVKKSLQTAANDNPFLMG